MKTAIATPTHTRAGRAFLTEWAQELGTGTPVSIREGTWLWRNANAVPGFRVRRIRRGVSQRNPRGAPGYFWRPAIWTLDKVSEDRSHHQQEHPQSGAPASAVATL
jgi:hypothetical protein